MIDIIPVIAAVVAIVGLVAVLVRLGSAVGAATQKMDDLAKAAASALISAGKVADRADADTKALAAKIDGLNEKLDQYVTFDHCDRMRATCEKASTRK